MKLDPSFVVAALDISTAHISPVTREWLQAQARNADPWVITVAEYRQGFFVRVPTDDREDELRIRQCPQDLQAIFAVARNAGCRLVCLDGDAETYPSLPLFEW